MKKGGSWVTDCYFWVVAEQTILCTNILSEEPWPLLYCNQMFTYVPLLTWDKKGKKSSRFSKYLLNYVYLQPRCFISSIAPLFEFCSDIREKSFIGLIFYFIQKWTFHFIQKWTFQSFISAKTVIDHHCL